MTQTSDTTRAVLAELERLSEMADNKRPGAREINGRQALVALPRLIAALRVAIPALSDLLTDAMLVDSAYDIYEIEGDVRDGAQSALTAIAQAFGTEDAGE